MIYITLVIKVQSPFFLFRPRDDLTVMDTDEESRHV